MNHMHSSQFCEPVHKCQPPRAPRHLLRFPQPTTQLRMFCGWINVRWHHKKIWQFTGSQILLKERYQYLNCFQNNPSFPNIICLCNYIPIPVPLCPVQLGLGWTWRNADLVGFHPCSINIISVISSKKVTSDNLMWQDLLISKGSKVSKPTFMRAPPNPALNIARIPSLSPSSLAALHLRVYQLTFSYR